MADVAAVVLAAGKASRWRASGGTEPTKLIAVWKGAPMVRCVALAALASRARPVVVVLGHEAAAVRKALDELPATFVENRDYAQGLSTSLRAGLAALPARCAGAVILLGDMPEVGAQVVDALIAAFAARPDALAVVPRGAEGLGNPVLLARGLFAQASTLRGDKGARGLVESAGARRVEVEWAGAEIALDIDERGA